MAEILVAGGALAATMKAFNTITALLQVGITLCQMETVQTQYRREVSKIAVRLADILSQKKSWVSALRTQDDTRSLTSVRFQEALQDVNKILEAALLPQAKWRRMIVEFIRSKDLMAELNNANTTLSEIIIQLTLQQSAVTHSEVLSISMMLAKLSHEPSYVGSGRTKQHDIDEALDDCYKNTTESTQETASSSLFSSEPDEYTIDRGDIVMEETEKNLLGQGAFADVYRGLYKGDNVAVKVVRFTQKSTRDMFLNEIKTMSECSINPNVTEVIGYCAPRESRVAMIVMELMEDSLSGLLHDKHYPLPHCDLLQLLKGISSALQFLHLQGIVHRDIKSSNILVDLDRMVAKLTDFGIATDKGLETTVMTRYGIATPGTPPYQAPEILAMQVKSGSRMADMYSFGATIWECLSREKPKLAAGYTVDQEGERFRFPVGSCGRNVQAFGLEEQHAYGVLEKTAYLCLSREPKLRPKATVVVEYLGVKRPFNNEDFACVEMTSWEDKLDIQLGRVEDEESKTKLAKVDPQQSHHLPASIPETNKFVGLCRSYWKTLTAFTLVLVAAFIIILVVSKGDHETSASSFEPPTVVPSNDVPELSFAPLPTTVPSFGNSETSYSPKDRPTTGSFQCFETTDELRSAVVSYLGQSDIETIRSRYGASIGDWCVEKITDFSYLFCYDSVNYCMEDGGFENPHGSSFDLDISGWNTSSAVSMAGMFYGTSLSDVDLSGWDVSGVTDMHKMFTWATDFNGNLSSWDVSKVTDMRGMFKDADSFNGDLSSWNVSQVTDMSEMFYSASVFDGDLSSWDVSQVTSMKSMFAFAKAFNGNLSSWDVSRVTDMFMMFGSASSFNSNISMWNVRSVTDMSAMFHDATTFNQNLCPWSNRMKEYVLATYSTFSGTSCPNTYSPDFCRSPPEPFCYDC